MQMTDLYICYKNKDDVGLYKNLEVYARFILGKFKHLFDRDKYEDIIRGAVCDVYCLIKDGDYEKVLMRINIKNYLRRNNIKNKEVNLLKMSYDELVEFIKKYNIECNIDYDFGNYCFTQIRAYFTKYISKEKRLMFNYEILNNSYLYEEDEIKLNLFLKYNLKDEEIDLFINGIKNKIEDTYKKYKLRSILYYIYMNEIKNCEENVNKNEIFFSVDEDKIDDFIKIYCKLANIDEGLFRALFEILGVKNFLLLLNVFSDANIKFLSSYNVNKFIKFLNVYYKLCNVKGKDNFNEEIENISKEFGVSKIDVLRIYEEMSDLLEK